MKFKKKDKIVDFVEFYNQDDRFRRYVDVCMKEEKKSLEEVLALKVIQNVGDYYKDNPVREPVPTVETMKSGGC